MGKTISKTNCCAPDQLSSNLTLSAEAERLSLSMDDEPILLSSSLDESRDNPAISVNFKFSSNYLQLSNNTQEWPVCISIGCSEQNVEDRLGIDIVCLIETSMLSKSKSDLIKSSLEFVMNRLSGQDRLSIVSFSDSARRLCPLMAMSYTGKIKVGMILRNLVYSGSSDLAEGAVFALSVLNNRRIVNSNSNILIFSRGRDNHPNSIKERISDILREFTFRINANFSTHVFAMDGAVDILTYIAEETNGNCYIPKDEPSMLQSIAYCCGVMESTIAENLNISILLLNSPIPYIISKVYSENAETEFRMPDMVSGSVIDTIFVIKFLPCSVTDLKELEIAKITIEYTFKGLKCLEEAGLKIPIFSQNKLCREIELHEDVLLSFYRVKAADIMNEAAEISAYDLLGAKELLEKGTLELEQCVINRTRFIQTLANELRTWKDNLSPTEESKAAIRNRARNHWTKRCFDIPEYQNSATIANKNRIRALLM
jgi:von Willebrand factor type A domain